MLGKAVLASALIAVAAAQDASVSSAIASDLVDYLNSIANNPSVVSILDAVETGSPDVYQSLQASGQAILQNVNPSSLDAAALSSVATAPITITTPALYDQLPSSVASGLFGVVTEVASAEQSIIASRLGLTPPGGDDQGQGGGDSSQGGSDSSKGAGAPMATPAPAVKLVGGVLVGVGVAVAML